MKARGFALILILLMLLSVHGVNHEQYNYDRTSNLSSQTTVEQLDTEIDNVDKKLMGGLESYMNNGLIPDNFTNRIMVFSSSNTLPFETLIPEIQLGGNYLHFVDNVTPDKVRKIYLDSNVKVALPDTSINYDLAPPGDGGGISTDSYQASDILKTQQVYDEYGFSGKGVKIGVIDSGVDFGITDLVDSAVLNPQGYLASLDITGTGIAITSLTPDTIVSEGRTYLALEDQVLDIFAGERGIIQTSDQLGINLRNLDITNLGVTSVSGNYKVGIAKQGSLVQNLPSQYFLFVLVDSTTSGVYDTLYVDMETSLAISLAQEGLIFTTGDTFTDLNEYDLNNDVPFGSNNPIPAKDITGDGINDISMGGLGTAVDFAGVAGKSIINGIDPDGNAIAMFFDPVGHGTLVASSAASNGTTEFPIFDDKTTEEIENGQTYQLIGSAPDAKIVAHKAFSISEFVLGWLWTGGLKLEETSNGINWVEEPTNLVDISSNSWGNGMVAPDGYLKGFDPYSLLLDYLSTQNALYQGYPGVVFVVSGGNGAPGYGTAATPGMASMAITVGSSTYYHYRDGATGRNDVAWFSARGPTGYGIIKPDIITPGHTGFVNVQVIQGYGNGTYASGTFGGTSEAAPRASGVLALMVEAFRNQSIEPTLEDLKLTLKSTATDLGFDPTQQGAGLANAYRAVKAIMDNELIISSTYSSEIAGDNLQAAFIKEFEMSHPLFTEPIADIVTAVTPEQMRNGITLELRYTNGTTVPSSAISTQLHRTELAYESSTEITSSQILNNIDIGEAFPENLISYDFMELSLTLNEETWDAFLNYGLNTPNITLYDDGSGDIIADQYSANTWAQLMFAGFPSADFSGQPILQFTDPGFLNSIGSWPGMTYNISSRFYTDTPMTANITVTNGEITVNNTSVPDELQIWELKVTNEGITQNVPIMISPMHQAKFANNVTAIGSNMSIIQPYNQYEVVNTFDWGYRPESGDFNHYRVQVPSEATFFASYIKWNVDGLQPNVYLFNSSGQLIKQSDTEYIGGGFYVTETSEPKSQNLLVEATDDTYYLMIHTTNLPFQPGPIDIEVFFRYLTLEKLPTPIPKFSQNIGSPLSGAFGIDVSDYTIDQFPEFSINSISAQVYQGRNGTVSHSISEQELNIGVNTEFSPNLFDDEITLEFNAGEKVRLQLDLENGVDADMYVYQEGVPLFRDNDLLGGLGSNPDAVDEEAIFAAEASGNYIIYIDYIGQSGVVDTFDYSLHYETRDGPTFTNDNDSITFNTEIFPDDIYGVKIIFSSNFDVDFEVRIQISTENSEPFTFSLLSPSNGSTVSEDISVSWESSRLVSVDIYLLIDGSWFLVGSDIQSTSYTFDSTIYPNGLFKIRVEATDGIYTISATRNIIIDNQLTSSLPEIRSSQVNDLTASYIISIGSMMMLLIFFRRNDTYNRERKFIDLN